MRLSWNEIRARAAAFAGRWEGASYERGDSQTFYNEFFAIFGVRRASVARFEAHVRKLNQRAGFIDLFWPGTLIVEQKSAGGDLRAAYDQAGGYFDALPEYERPRHILVSDFRTFDLHDLESGESFTFALADLPNHIDRFGFILGLQRRTFRDQDPANIKAAELMGRLHDSLAAAGYRGHDLERFLVRIVFCLFADNTGIFEPRDLLLEFLDTRTREDGSDLGPWLHKLFEVLDTPEDRRSAALDEDLARFPHVNGDLFEERLGLPDFTSRMRQQLLDASRFDWSVISPAIFGSLFQSVMDPEERRAQGAHYTTEANILKVIEPLFLDDLRAEFARIKGLKRGRRTRLQEFHRRLGALAFLDPACGCGNFLIVAYRELRRLEIDVLDEILVRENGMAPGQLFSRLNVHQFHGIEIGEFAARIAETALWMMDHIMNVELGHRFGQAFVRIPLERSPRILHADALEMDWSELLAPERCSFVFGNPPFGGSKHQAAHRREQTRRVAGLGGSGGTLDYVAAWFIKAGEYARESGMRIGFVATNSITQGEQAAQLWPVLFGRFGLEIAFAHRTFKWSSEARGVAHVYVVILGLAGAPPPERRLFSYEDAKGEPHESRHRAISPYLFDADGLADPHLTVREEARPINGMPRLVIGSKPIDGGHLIFDSAERAAFLAAEPGAAPFLRPYVGAREFLQGGARWILALQDASPDVLARLPKVRERLAAVRRYREASRSESTRKLAATPTLYHVNTLPTAPFLAIPEVSTARREYAPIDWLEPPVVPSNLVRVLEHATLTDFALVTSAMHMAWLRHIGGRLGNGYRYSAGVVYNTFPPPPEGADRSRLKTLASAVIAARVAHPKATLANLYDPDLMPPDLRNAHRNLDRAVDKLYRPGKTFVSERERVEHLFPLYERMRKPLTASRKKKRRRRRRVVR